MLIDKRLCVLYMQVGKYLIWWKSMWCVLGSLWQFNRYVHLFYSMQIWVFFPSKICQNGCNSELQIFLFCRYCSFCFCLLTCIMSNRFPLFHWKYNVNLFHTRIPNFFLVTYKFCLGRLRAMILLYELDIVLLFLVWYKTKQNKTNTQNMWMVLIENWT